MRYHNTVVFIFTALQGHTEVVHALPSQAWSHSKPRMDGKTATRGLVEREVPAADVSALDNTATDLLSLDNEAWQAMVLESLGDTSALERRVDFTGGVENFNTYTQFVLTVGSIIYFLVIQGKKIIYSYGKKTPAEIRDNWQQIADLLPGIHTAEQARHIFETGGRFGYELLQTLGGNVPDQNSGDGQAANSGPGNTGPGGNPGSNPGAAPPGIE